MGKEKIKIAVASGKGGVGKSMLASSLAMLFQKSKKTIAVDCDVDAPNLHLWLGEDEKWDKVERVFLTQKPAINLKKCTGCARCSQICAFGAIEMKRQKPVLNKFLCEGCGACKAVCPEKAIRMKPVKNAQIRIKNNVFGFPLISGQLYPGESGSGKIVAQIKQEAENFDYQVMVLDSSAGSGCPVIASLNGVDFALLVTEPTLSAFSDLKQVLKVVNFFKTPYGVVINKFDINSKTSREIEKYSNNRLLGKIGYDKRVFGAITDLVPILKTSLPVAKEIEAIFLNLKKFL